MIKAYEGENDPFIIDIESSKVPVLMELFD